LGKEKPFSRVSGIDVCVVTGMAHRVLHELYAYAKNNKVFLANF